MEDRQVGGQGERASLPLLVKGDENGSTVAILLNTAFASAA